MAAQPLHPQPEQPRPEEPDSAAEAQRLAALRRYDILDTPPDGAFDRITELAADLFEVPIAIISLVDHDRIWFKSHHGLDAEQISRDAGLCASAILHDEPWILPDARKDIHALANPLVAGAFGLRFYAGIPLRTHDGFNLGTLCVIDREPRPAPPLLVTRLEKLAAIVMDQMELRLAARRAVGNLAAILAEKDAALRHAELMAKEVDHRVKNSLQLISGLLRMQGASGEALGQEATEQIEIAADRVLAVARVHQHIYLGDGIEQARCRTYLERLCNDIAAMLRPADQGGIVVRGPEIVVPAKQLESIGLIANELVTNAIKHGGGRVTVSLHGSVAEGYALSVADEGGGLPPGYDPKRSRRLGMKVVLGLARQLGGDLEAGTDERSGGAVLTVHFPGTEGAAQH